MINLIQTYQACGKKKREYDKINLVILTLLYHKKLFFTKCSLYASKLQ